MRIIDSPQGLERSLTSGLDGGVLALLSLRRDLIDLATFVIIDASDSLVSVEAVAGLPINVECPPWEWVLDHGGVFEAPIITSDDGSGVVLIVPNSDDIDPVLLTILRDNAELDEPVT